VLEGTFKGCLFQPTCNEQGHLQTDQGAQSPVQPDPESFHRRGINHLSGQPVPVFHHPHTKYIDHNFKMKYNRNAILGLFLVKHFWFAFGAGGRTKPKFGSKK